MTDKNIIAGAPTEEPARQQYFYGTGEEARGGGEREKRPSAHLFYQHLRVPDECQRLRKTPWNLKGSRL